MLLSPKYPIRYGLHITRGGVAGDDVDSTVGAGGRTHTDIGRRAPHDLGVVTKVHVVGVGDDLSVVARLLVDPHVGGAHERSAVVAHVEVLALARGSGVGESADGDEMFGPDLCLGSEARVPDERG